MVKEDGKSSHYAYDRDTLDKNVLNIVSKCMDKGTKTPSTAGMRIELGLNCSDEPIRNSLKRLLNKGLIEYKGRSAKSGYTLTNDGIAQVLGMPIEFHEPKQEEWHANNESEAKEIIDNMNQRDIDVTEEVSYKSVIKISKYYVIDDTTIKFLIEHDLIDAHAFNKFANELEVENISKND